MTRVNAGIAPEELSNKHLLAEHREIKRIPNMVKSGRAVIKNIPDEFRMGKGHVKFFYNKIGYLRERYEKIYDLCVEKKYSVTSFHSAFEDIPEELDNGWKETKEARRLVMERIKERSK